MVVPRGTVALEHMVGLEGTVALQGTMALRGTVVLRATVVLMIRVNRRNEESGHAFAEEARTRRVRSLGKMTQVRQRPEAAERQHWGTMQREEGIMLRETTTSWGSCDSEIRLLVRRGFRATIGDATDTQCFC